MKSTYTYLTGGLLSLLLTTAASAQEWSIGPKAYLGLSRVLTVGDQAQLPIGTIATVADGDQTGSVLGVFARYDRPSWYAEVNAMQGSSSFANLSVTSFSGGGPTYPRARRYDFRLLAGYKPLPWLRLSAGLVGVANNWRNRDYTADIDRLEALAQAAPNAETRDRFQGEANGYRLNDLAGKALKRNLLEAQLGIGTDIGGLTLDLTYNPGLSPIVDGATYLGRTYAIQQRYAYWSLGIGYKLFPLKSHLLAPRKNKAYARIQRDIPFVRNEFSVGVGLVAEDLNSAFIYENRYTRYLSPRFGLTAGLAFQRGLSGYKAYDPTTYVYRNGGFSATNKVSLLLAARALLLYSRHHRIGFGFGAQLSYTDAIAAGNGSRTVTVNGQPVQMATTNLTSSSRQNRLQVTQLIQLDYQFLLTDRLAVGPWLRATDSGSFGIQAGYRF